MTAIMRNEFAKLYSINSEAPDLLLKKINELDKTLRAARTNSPTVKSQKAIDFYESILATMKFSWAYMNDFNFLHKRNKNLESENEFLKDYALTLKNKLNKYETIEQLKVSGEFDEIVKNVTDYMINNNDLNQ